MTFSLKKSLHQELIHLNTLLENTTGSNTFPGAFRESFTDSVIDDTVNITNVLLSKPYLPARDISEQLSVTKTKLAFMYKLIQRSDELQSILKKSVNRDYFQVVNHYFNRRFFTAVFFVGTTCPSRCIYCPNVSLDKNGERTLARYIDPDNPKLSRHHFETIFNDLKELKEKGTDILVKISGGLEPLTDTITMNWITDRSKTIGVPVKLFTNGLLLNSADNRTAALKTNDIRISLSTTNAEQYEKICFDSRRSSGRQKALVRLRESIRSLVDERNRREINCKIGFNSIVMPTNLNQLIPLITMADELGIDYIDFKPDYFSTHDKQSEHRIALAVSLAARYAKTMSDPRLFVNFSDSLQKTNLYWNSWKGYCDSVKQSQYKIFVTPFGHCSPVHYGAFPHPGEHQKKNLESYSIGQVSDTLSLGDILKKPAQRPKVTLNKLNPFELMLNLEINREETDSRWGIPITCSPYHTSLRDDIPETLFPIARSL